MQKDTVPMSKKSEQKYPEGAVLRSMGIRTDQIADRTELLQRRGYTIVKYVQYPDPKRPKKFKHRFLEAIPPGVPIVEAQESNEQNRMCMYFCNPNPRAAEPLRVETTALIVGLSNIDVSTGSVTLYEILHDTDNIARGLDEAYRFLQASKPVKISIIFRGFSKWSGTKCSEFERFIVNKLELGSQPQNVQISVKFVGQNRDDIYERSGDIEYQQSILSKIYTQFDSNPSKLSRRIGLEKVPFACTALTIEFNELSICDPSIFRRMRLPEIWTSQNILVLQHNAVEQLDLAPSSGKNSNCGCSVNKRLALVKNQKKRPDYLIDVIDRTTTNMGARLLMKWLKAPSNSATEIHARLETVDSLMDLTKESRTIFHQGLKNIRIDIARTIRLSQFGQFGPKHMRDLVLALQSVIDLMSLVLQIPEGKQWTERSCPKYAEVYVEKISNFIETVNASFHVDALKVLKISDWKSEPENLRFFNRNNNDYSTIHTIFDDIDKSGNILTECQESLATLLFPNLRRKRDELQKKVGIKFIQKTGDVYFSVSKANHSLLNYYIKEFSKPNSKAQWFDGKQDFSDRGGIVGIKKRMTKKSSFVDEVNSDEEVQDEQKSQIVNFQTHLASFSSSESRPAPTATTKKVDPKISKILTGMEFYRVFGGSVQIPAASESQSRITESLKVLQEEVQKAFDGFVKDILDPLCPILDEVCDLVASVDVLYSHSVTSLEHNYHKPELISDELPFIDATAMRHPIIECRLVNTEFIPNDVKIGRDCTGLLIYGLNNIGKTSFEKAVALNLILAQIGCFVAAETWKFCPFDSIVTRLNGQDNMLGGQGTFAVEMTELVTILNGDERTLAIGDEVCHGTEPESAVSLVAATVRDLAARKIPFLFATHLHHLTHMKEVSELKNIKFIHFHAETDPVTHDIIYNRKILDGAGSDSYGIEVAKAQGIPERIIRDAMIIRRSLKREPGDLISTRTSHFNHEKIMDICELEKCDERKDLDVHHIRFQSEADERGMIDGRFHKHNKHNLVTLCKTHHQNVHKGLIKINGWSESLDRGLFLDYEEERNPTEVLSYICTESGTVQRRSPRTVSIETKKPTEIKQQKLQFNSVKRNAK
jgi:DNA mismatch repair ATPase MutS